MVQGQVFLKQGGGGGGGGEEAGFFPISFFQGYNFYIQKFFYPWQNCVMHLKKQYFSCYHNFMKKGHSKFSKN